ncbi:MAG TPA: hypothetical protein VGD66_15145 [Allosphingosinicella sp.]
MERADGLLTTILTYAFQVERAGEFARTGFGRRLGCLEHAMKKMDTVYPPNSPDASRDQVRDAELILQAFVMNVFGAIDNLAWIWALERRVTGAKAQALYPAEICFVGPRSGWMVASLLPPVVAAIDNAKEWFNQIGAYRHGVAHQIPIYIPRLFSADDAKTSEELGAAINEAIAAGDTKRMLPLLNRRHSLGNYGAYMALNGEQRPMLLHPQMVCDLATVVELGEIIMSELSKPAS